MPWVKGILWQIKVLKSKIFFTGELKHSLQIRDRLIIMALFTSTR